MTILVCPLAEVEMAVRLHRPQRVVSLLSPGAANFPDFDVEISALRVECHDIVEPLEGLSPPTAEQIEGLLHFIGQWSPPEPLLFHCWAGVSRSTAAAYIAACSHAGAGQEERLARALRAASPFATPNALMVRLADQALGRGGAMIRAAQSIGRGQETEVGRLFSFVVADETAR